MVGGVIVGMVILGRIVDLTREVDSSDENGETFLIGDKPVLLGEEPDMEGDLRESSEEYGDGPSFCSTGIELRGEVKKLGSLSKGDLGAVGE